jgi:phosphate transport system substrate-binding protein
MELGENANVDLKVSGTSVGMYRLCSGEIDIANASRSISKEEQELCLQNGVDYLEFVIGVDGIAVVVNQDNDWVDYITVSELKKLWQAESERVVNRWNQLRPEWPDEEIKLFGPSTASGTHSYFTEQIVGEGKTTRGDYAATENDEVLVLGVAESTYGLGIFGLAYYQENFYRLKLVPVDDENPDNGMGPFQPTRESIKNRQYQPLFRDLYLYVSTESLEDNRTKRFLNYYLENAGSFVQAVGYIPQPQSVYRDYLDLISTEEESGS